MSTQAKICRPFVDLTAFQTATQFDFYSDARKGINKGFGCVFGSDYLWGQWDLHFIKNCDPSIEYLELFALTAGILTWGYRLTRCRVIIFCDNQAVIHMVNNISSSCKNCMVLIRKLVLNGLFYDRRLFVKFVKTKENGQADALSQLQFNHFFKLSLASRFVTESAVPIELWPMSKIWLK